MLAWLLLVAQLVHSCDKEYTLSDLTILNTTSLFQDWSKAFNRKYSRHEKDNKYSIWLNNLYYIANHNSQNHSFKLNLNTFADINSNTIRKLTVKRNPQQINFKSKRRLLNIPSSIDWTSKGVVTPVQNQRDPMDCNSGWAFSALGAIECNYAIKTGTLNTLSAQQLINCQPAASGCSTITCRNRRRIISDRSDTIKAFEYAIDNGGMCSLTEYPYTATKGECNANCSTKYNKIYDWDMISIKDENAMQEAVASGCVSVGIQADQTDFKMYSSGIFESDNCGSCINHHVLIVGYGTSADGSKDYWKIKNSWGLNWGEGGYAKLCRNCNKNNGEGQCGILKEGVIPTWSIRVKSNKSCATTSNEQFQALIKSRYEVEQIIYEFNHMFDDTTLSAENGNKFVTIDELIAWIKSHLIPEFSLSGWEGSTISSRKEFIDAMPTIKNTFDKHFVTTGGVQFIEETKDFIKTRVNHLTTGIRYIDSKPGKEIYEQERVVYEFVKVECVWKISSISVTDTILNPPNSEMGVLFPNTVNHNNNIEINKFVFYAICFGFILLGIFYCGIGIYVWSRMNQRNIYKMIEVMNEESEINMNNDI